MFDIKSITSGELKLRPYFGYHADKWLPIGMLVRLLA